MQWSCRGRQKRRRNEVEYVRRARPLTFLKPCVSFQDAAAASGRPSPPEPTENRTKHAQVWRELSPLDLVSILHKAFAQVSKHPGSVSHCVDPMGDLLCERSKRP